MNSPRLAFAFTLASLLSPCSITMLALGQETADSIDQIEPEETTENPFGFQLNLDFTNAYFYRGIIQQDDGLIIQPAAKLTINLHEEGGFKVDALLGTWNSFGDNSGTNTGDLISDWYESDLYGGLVFTMDKFTLTTTYTYLTSPSDAYQTVQELDFILGYDDSELLGSLALHPYALVAIEFGADGSDGANSGRGKYLELGIAPGLSFDLSQTPVALSFPLSVGLSIDDYYQDAAGTDETFGFAQVGAKAAIPLPVGDHYGQWTLNAGASALFLGDHTKAYNGGDDTEFIATIGLQLNF